MSKQHFLESLANALSENRKTMSFNVLADILNKAGFGTNDDQDYKGKRGTSRLVASAKRGAKNEDTAENISTVFRGKDGKLPYENK